jgi:hypothetical protein
MHQDTKKASPSAWRRRTSNDETGIGRPGVSLSYSTRWEVLWQVQGGKAWRHVPTNTR